MRKLLLTFLVLPSLAFAQTINTPPTISSFNQLKGSTGGTITGFGTAVGQALGPLATVGGQPGLFVPTGGRLVFNMIAAATDYSTINIQRTTSYTGGTSANIVRALGVETSAGANDGANEWNLVAKCTTASTVASGLCLGSYNIGTRSAGSSALVKGLIAQAIDLNDQASSLSGDAVNAAELDVDANGADDQANSAAIGNMGVRTGIHLVGVRQTGSDLAQTQFAYGMWMSTSGVSAGVSDAHTNFMSGIGFARNTQVYSPFDARGAIPPTSSTAPVYALNMDAGQAIEFKGDDSTLAPAPARTMLYTGTALAYQVSGVTKFAVSDTGVLSSAGTAGVSCASGGVTAATMVVVGGIVTHC